MTQRVLKADEVTVEAPLCLGFDTPEPSGAVGSSCRSAGPRVQIARNEPDYAVLEVTCPCGQTTFIRCEYAQ